MRIFRVPDGTAAGDGVSCRELDCALEMGNGCIELARIGRKPACFPPQGKLVGRFGGDLKRLLHVRERVGG